MLPCAHKFGAWVICPSCGFLRKLLLGGALTAIFVLVKLNFKQ